MYGITIQKGDKMGNVIEIWQPRWKYRCVLVAVGRVREGFNFLRFTKTPSMKGIYRFDGTYVRQECEVQSNGKIPCFVIPLYMLTEVPNEYEQ
jgi:hypothetical protein